MKLRQRVDQRFGIAGERYRTEVALGFVRVPHAATQREPDDDCDRPDDGKNTEAERELNEWADSSAADDHGPGDPAQAAQPLRAEVFEMRDLVRRNRLKLVA